MAPQGHKKYLIWSHVRNDIYKANIQRLIELNATAFFDIFIQTDSRDNLKELSSPIFRKNK